MSQNLVIVESPAKAKTIQKFLGKDYTVMSSFGHIRDLPQKGLNIDIANGFTPLYAVSDDKKKVVTELRKQSKNSQVWLASDEDREGEAIAWHLAQALKLDIKTTKRIVFHEITKTAILNAISHPRTINQDLVDAQQARRILDRLVGYELSPVLWKKIKSGLSAGRVQSVAVRLIVEREREINDTILTSDFKVSGTFNIPNSTDVFQADLNKRFDTETNAYDWLNSLQQATYTVKAITSKDSTRQPGAPYTTSTLQQEASRRLGFSVKQTMLVAQKLYESGHITYMRTDSTLLSEQALSNAKDYIIKNFGAKYHKLRQFKTKNASAQEAHEAIRPTDFNKKALTTIDDNLNRLYGLIWQKTLSSQMSAANLLKSEATIEISDKQEFFTAKGEIIKFKGFLELYDTSKIDSLLPPINQNDKLTNQSIEAIESFSRPPARYSEASLVKKLEELGIGRPSTYSPTISTIQTRGYVEKVDLEGKERKLIQLILINNSINKNILTTISGADKNKLTPTSIAEVTTDFLVKFFSTIVDYKFTAKVEAEFDKIADGKEIWVDSIKKFYNSFHPLVENSDTISRKEASQARLIGVDPVSQQNIYARFGKFGPMLQKGDGNETDDKPIFAPMPNDTTIDTVTLEDALEMFKLPRTIGSTDNGEDIVANIGRFGPYVKINQIFLSIKPLDPHKITKEEALKLYQEKIEKDKAKNIKDYENGIKIINGPYGPYLTDGKKNARIPKDIDPLKISLEEAQEMIGKAKVKKKRFSKKFSNR